MGLQEKLKVAIPPLKEANNQEKKAVNLLAKIGQNLGLKFQNFLISISSQ